MVTKEQRRGVRADISELADFVRQKGQVDLGEIMLKFGWSTSKTYAMMAAVTGKTHQDIERRGGVLLHSPVEDDS